MTLSISTMNGSTVISIVCDECHAHLMYITAELPAFSQLGPLERSMLAAVAGRGMQLVLPGSYVGTCCKSNGGVEK